jgi:hypothetical protein
MDFGRGSLEIVELAAVEEPADARLSPPSSRHEPLQGPLAGVCHARQELGSTCLLGAGLLPIWSPAAIHY